MTEIEIRPTVPTDLGALAEVLVRVHAADGYPVEGVENPRLWVDVPNPLGQWTALVGARPVGHVALMKPDSGDVAPSLLSQQEGLNSEKIGVLARLFVDPEMRGRSIARKLVATADSMARKLDLWLTLDVMAKDRAAIRLYETLGWEKIGAFTHTYKDGAVDAFGLRGPRPGLKAVPPAIDTGEPVVAKEYSHMPKIDAASTSRSHSSDATALQLGLDLDLDVEDSKIPHSDLSFDLAVLGLGLVPGLGTRAVQELSHKYGESLGGLWQLDKKQLSNVLRGHKIAAAERAASLIVNDGARILDSAQRWSEELQGRMVTILPPASLPEKLRAAKGAPAYLFIQGDPSALEEGPHIAVVGTRKSSSRGRAAAAAVVRTMAAYPGIMVSGLADGIDAAAHASALADGIKNVAFLGHGTDLVFPAGTAELRERIISNGGAVVSEYLPNEGYRKQYFVQRNRLQASLADIVVGVEGERAGGTAHTVRFAVDMRRYLVGLHWPGAPGLEGLIAEVPHSTVIDIFSGEGRRHLDSLFREAAELYGWETDSLSLVRKQLHREARLRNVRQSDLAALSEALDGINS